MTCYSRSSIEIEPELKCALALVLIGFFVPYVICGISVFV